MNFPVAMEMRQPQIGYIVASTFDLTIDMMEAPLHIMRNLLVAESTITALI
jgi:hypothetical protein